MFNLWRAGGVTNSVQELSFYLILHYITSLGVSSLLSSSFLKILSPVPLIVQNQVKLSFASRSVGITRYQLLWGPCQSPNNQVLSGRVSSDKVNGAPDSA